MIVPILIGVTILVALVALYMSRETWRIYHIVLGFFLLVANVLFLYLAGRALDTHRQWRSEVRKYETAYAQQYDQFKLLTGELDGRGEVVVKRAEKVTQSIPWTIDDWKAELAAATYGRGRVLTRLVPKVDPATGAITAAALQPEPVTLPAGSSVHVFQSQPLRERKLPYKGTEVVITTLPIVRYIGAYIVSTVTGNTINLAPVHPERPPKIDGPLVVYEVAPVDTHDAFAHLEPEQIKLLFPPTVPPAIVEQYLKDGKEVDPKDADNPNVWRTVRFTKEYSSKVMKAEQPAQPAAPPPAADAAAAEPGEPAPEADGVVATREMKFQPGDEAVLDPGTAAELVKAGVAEYVQSRRDENVFSHVYRRPLNDYPVAFREVRAQLLGTNVKSTELQRQIEATQKAIELAKQTEQLRQQEAARLAQDLEKFRFEAETIQKLHDALVTSVKDATDQIESLKQSIETQADQLARLQLKAAEAIDRRTGATAARTQ